MWLKDYYKPIAGLFLLLFLTIRLLGFHVVSHDDLSEESCQLCEMMIQQEQQPVLSENTPDYIPEPITIPADKHEIFAPKGVIDRQPLFRLFSRPPPVS